MTLTLTDTIKLTNGVEIPRVGLGVFRAARGQETQSAVKQAILLGYRHVDTARVYQNEADVGAAVANCGLPRSAVFVTSKLWNDDQGYDQTLRAFDASIGRIGLDYLDLFLLHWPVAEKRLSSWKALEKLYKDGRVKAIGVSNFMPHHLEELLTNCQVIPHVNQIEVSPFFQQRAVRQLCEKHGIVVEAYSPLTKGYRLNHPVVSTIANETGRSAAQVLLRWGLQQQLVVLPKSTNADRQRENLSLFDFELSEEQINNLNQLEEGLVTGWDPRNQPLPLKGTEP